MNELIIFQKFNLGFHSQIYNSTLTIRKIEPRGASFPQGMGRF